MPQMKTSDSLVLKGDNGSLQKKKPQLERLAVGGDLANFDLFFFVFCLMLSGHMIPQPVP